MRTEHRAIIVTVLVTIGLVVMDIQGQVDGRDAVRSEAVSKGYGYFDANKKFHWRGE